MSETANGIYQENSISIGKSRTIQRNVSNIADKVQNYPSQADNNNVSISSAMRDAAKSSTSYSQDIGRVMVSTPKQI